MRGRPAGRIFASRELEEKWPYTARNNAPTVDRQSSQAKDGYGRKVAPGRLMALIKATAATTLSSSPDRREAVGKNIKWNWKLPGPRLRRLEDTRNSWKIIMLLSSAESPLMASCQHRLVPTRRPTFKHVLCARVIGQFVPNARLGAAFFICLLLRNRTSATGTGAMSVLWYFPLHRWGMAPGSALEIPRCCRYGDQPPLYLTLGDRYRVPLAFAFSARCKTGRRPGIPPLRRWAPETAEELSSQGPEQSRLALL